MKTALFLTLMLLAFLTAKGQLKTLSLEQQKEDFKIFKGTLNEGHAGLYYFIDKTTFEKKCDSLEQTFKKDLTVEDFYLKLRFIISALNHGHTRISLPTKGNVNYKMAILDSTKLYLPFEFLIVDNQLIIKEDCSKEQVFGKYTVVKSINGVKSKDLLQKMLPYIAADGINQSFKYYNLYNYYYFHHLFELFYPDKKGVSIVLEDNKRNYVEYYIELLKPRVIESNYFNKNKKNISQYSQQLALQTNLVNQAAYLKVGSFYKGLIEQFGQNYLAFLDSAFKTIHSNEIKNLIVDLRDNEGGGDGYENMLTAHLVGKKKATTLPISVAGRSFPYLKYATYLTDDIKGFIANPQEFLRDDSTLFIKEKYVAMMTEDTYTPKNVFKGNIVVLMNGGSFSASNAVIGQLYEFRKKNNRNIVFVGEENGGDIYVGTGCAGQGYIIQLPNSAIQVDMPFLCFGELKKEYPKKRLPDYEIFPTLKDLRNNIDTVLNFALEKLIKSLKQ